MSIAQNIQVIADIAYLGRDREEKLDLYLPAQNKHERSSPAIIVIHGGGFSGGDKADPREKNICTNLANQGYICASINYKLSTEENRWSSFPQNLYDVKTAIYFLCQNNTKYDLNPETIGVIGGSAGGTLALLAGITSTIDGLNPRCLASYRPIEVQAIVNMYGPTDFSCEIIQSAVHTPDELVRKVSPVTYVHTNIPPVLTIHGTADKIVPVSQAHCLNEALKNNGGYHELKIVDGAAHSFDLQPPQDDIRPVVFSFFERFLKDNKTR